jgi:hypothetical protein
MQVKHILQEGGPVSALLGAIRRGYPLPLSSDSAL